MPHLSPAFMRQSVRFVGIAAPADVDGCGAASPAQAEPRFGNGARILSDMRALFETSGQPHLSTMHIIAELSKSRRYAELRGHRMNSSRVLSKMLRAFGVLPKQIDYGGAEFKGYHMEDLAVACVKYLDDTGAQVSRHPREARTTEGPALPIVI